MPEAKLGYTVVDIDSHFYEPAAIWDHFIPTESQTTARSAFWHGLDSRGNRLTILNGAPAKELSRTKIVRHAIWQPGMTPDDIGELDPHVPHPINPGAYDVDARLADMDTLGIEQAVVYPTLFNEYLPLVENPLAADILARAYNDWAASMADSSGGRLHPVAVLPMQSLMFAQREVDRVAELGLKGVVMRPMYYTGDATIQAGPPRPRARGATMDLGVPRGVFVDSRHFRPLWAQIEALGLVACVHPSVGSTNPDGTSLGTYIERVSEVLEVGHSVAETVAYMQDNGWFLLFASYQGLFEDFPRLKASMAHGGASFIPLVLEKSETYLWLATTFPLGLTGEPVSLEPEAVLEQHRFVVGFDSYESPVARMADIFEDLAGWGSLYPHHDAGSPSEAIKMLEDNDVDRETVARFMGGNAVDVFGLKVPASA